MVMMRKLTHSRLGKMTKILKSVADPEPNFAVRL